MNTLLHANENKGRIEKCNQERQKRYRARHVPL